MRNIIIKVSPALGCDEGLGRSHPVPAYANQSHGGPAGKEEQLARKLEEEKPGKIHKLLVVNRARVDGSVKSFADSTGLMTEVLA